MRLHAQYWAASPSAIFAFDDSGQTALHIAAAKRNPELVAYLIRSRAKLNPDDNGGKTPLHCAELCGNEVIVRALVSKGADVQVKDVYAGHQRTTRTLHLSLSELLRSELTWKLEMARDTRRCMILPSMVILKLYARFLGRMQILKPKDAGSGLH